MQSIFTDFEKISVDSDLQDIQIKKNQTVMKTKFEKYGQAVH